MNKEKLELLEKCIKIKSDQEIPILGGIYIIPTKYKHDSGYKIMHIIGHTRDYEECKFYLLDTCCDVIDFGQFVNENIIRDLHLDIKPSGIIHIWSNRQDMRNIFRCSNCSFEMLDRGNNV